MVDLSTMLLSETDVSCGGTICWMAPELLDPPRFGSSGRPTRASDCYALGMVIYEVGWAHSPPLPFIHLPQVLTGLRPFHRLCTYETVLAILRGEHPEEPLDAKSLGLSYELWRFVQLCWNESSSSRPTAQRLFDYLSPASLSWAPPPTYLANKIDVFGIGSSLAPSRNGKVKARELEILHGTNPYGLCHELYCGTTSWVGGRTGQAT